MDTLDKREYAYKGFAINGFVMLLVLLALCGLTVYTFYTEMIVAEGTATGTVLLLLYCILFGLLCKGFFIQQPNDTRVIQFFGKYVGTFRGTGYYWINPFMSHYRMSVRLQNLDINPIKVNDKVGNPVMIGMVVVWKVSDTYRAAFDVGGSLEHFVSTQSDAALREVTGRYAYDNEEGKHDEITLRSDGAEISDELERKINERLAMAGVTVVEARLNYLAYAPEIAAVMLRRQQASAIISAREKIVEGAVSMVQMALRRLSEEQVVQLDEERKAAMVSNMLVVLCADEPAQPVVNTGSN